MLQKLQEARVAENQNMGNARVIESALVPDKALPFKPAMVLALGTVVSILLCGATVAVPNLSRPTVHVTHTHGIFGRDSRQDQYTASRLERQRAARAGGARGSQVWRWRAAQRFRRDRRYGGSGDDQNHHEPIRKKAAKKKTALVD